MKDIIVIANLHDALEEVVDKYGMIKVLQHLAKIANVKMSKVFAEKIYKLTTND
jgi:predicted transcriptional regulator